MGSHSFRVTSGGASVGRVAPGRAVLAAIALAALPMAASAFVSVGISINIAPPELPVYVQPPCPAVGYIWTPGYWAYGDDDYYWVPGTWVLAPSPGLLWTPGYWGWEPGGYIWHAGYWGPHVGFYGGVNYGYGYGGVGFEGGYWRGGAFYYNRSVNNISNIHVTNVYNRTVVNNITVNRVSYNGGEGGLTARPTSRELSAEHEHHVGFTAGQRQQEHMAFGNHDLRASVNAGKPPIAATARPGVFSGHGIVAAREAGAPFRGAGHGTSGRAEPGSAEPVRAMRNDRPPGSTGAEFHSGRSGGSSPSSISPGGSAGHMETRPQVGHSDRPTVTPRINQGNELRSERNGPQGARPEMQQSAPHFQQSAPRPQMNFPQNMPHSQSTAQPGAPRPDAARPQFNRGGGGAEFRTAEPRGGEPRSAAPRGGSEPRVGEPRGQGQPHGQSQPHVQGPGRGDPRDHGRR